MTFNSNHRTRYLALLGTTLISTAAYGEDAANREELAKKLANPVASLISMPMQLNYDSNIGPDDAGERTVLNLQPVIPFSLNDDWNIISRTILPVVSQTDIAPNSGSQSGIGDIVQSVFFSPTLPTDSGWIVGAGPVALMPTASDKYLGADQWGLGPTAVALKQDGPWSYGALANHIWSVSHDNSAEKMSMTFLQPFLIYTTEDAVTYSINTESTYDALSHEWSIPVNASVSKVVNFGEQLVSVGGSVRYWAKSPENGAEGVGFRLTLTFLFPK